VLNSVITHFTFKKKMTMPSSQKVWEKAYQKIDVEHLWTIRDIAFLNVLRKYVKKGDKVLDVGCGTGKFDVLLTRKGAYTILLDFSLSVLRNTREIFHSYKSKEADFILTDIRHIPLKDNSIDVCYSEGVIEHFKNTEKRNILSEKRRVTRFGGYVITSCPNRLDVLYQIYKFLFNAIGRWKYGFSNLLSMFDLESLMQSAGLEIMERKGTLNNLLLFPLYFIFKHSILKRLCYPKPNDPVALRLGKLYVPPILGFWLICVGMKK